MKEKTLNSLLESYNRNKEIKNAVKKIEIPSLGEELTFTKVNRSITAIAYRILGKLREVSSTIESHEPEEMLFAKLMQLEDFEYILRDLSILIYESCAELKDEKLLSEVGVNMPYEVVEEILTPVDIIAVGIALISFLLPSEDEIKDEKK